MMPNNFASITKKIIGGGNIPLNAAVLLDEKTSLMVRLKEK
jgi:hypothetical protein